MPSGGDTGESNIVQLQIHISIFIPYFVINAPNSKSNGHIIAEWHLCGYVLIMFFLLAGQACKYQEWWHHRRQPEANPGIDLDNHFALSGECFHLKMVKTMCSDFTTQRLQICEVQLLAFWQCCWELSRENHPLAWTWRCHCGGICWTLWYTHCCAFCVAS